MHCRRESGSLAQCLGLQGWSGEVQHTEASGAVGHASGSITLCQQPRGRRGGAQGRSGPCFQQGKRWQEEHKPMVGHGVKNLPVCYLQKMQGHGKTHAGIKSGTFHIGFPCRVQIIGAVWMAKALLLQAERSPALVFSLCSQIVPTQVAELDSGASRVDCGLCARNAAYTTGWDGSWEPQLLVPRPPCSWKPRQVSARGRANTLLWCLY